MTYTINQLQQMSDFEVNKALCIKLGYDVTGISEQRNMMTGAVIDYCNNPNDIMPLAFERGVSINTASSFDYDNGYFGEGKWVASESIAPCQGMTIDCSGLAFAHDNPLRAIACLLLMMED